MPKPFQSYLSNASNKTNLVNYIFQQWEKILSEYLSSYQSVYLAKLHGTTDCLTKQHSKRIEFYCDHGETDTKIFAHIKFLSDKVQLKKVIIHSPDTYVDVMSLYC